jgi:hypothetical protein
MVAIAWNEMTWRRAVSKHRVATAAFWRIFHHDGKISPGWRGWGAYAHPFSLHLTSRTKLHCALKLSRQINSPYFISTNICSLWRLCTRRPENHTPVRDLTRDGRLSTYDESVLKGIVQPFELGGVPRRLFIPALQ